MSGSACCRVFLQSVFPQLLYPYANYPRRARASVKSKVSRRGAYTTVSTHGTCQWLEFVCLAERANRKLKLKLMGFPRLDPSPWRPCLLKYSELARKPILALANQNLHFIVARAAITDSAIQLLLPFTTRSVSFESVLTGHFLRSFLRSRLPCGHFPSRLPCEHFLRFSWRRTRLAPLGILTHR